MKKYIFKNILILLVLGILFIIAGLFTSDKTGTVSVQEDTLKKTPDRNVLPAKDAENNFVFISKVLDGDTVETDRGEKIRYLGINAPEKGQPESSNSTVLNKELVLNKKVRLEFDVQTKDRYGRILAYVFVDNINYSNNLTEVFVNLEMIKNGLAVSETIQPNVKYQDEFIKNQEAARNRCLGIWEGLCSKDSNQDNGKCIKIAEIHADAPGDDNKNKNGEWIRLQNNCSKALNISNWLLKDNSASNKYEFNNFILEKNKSITIYSGCGTNSENNLYWQCPESKYAIWNNDTDHAYLYNDKGSLESDFGY